MIKIDTNRIIARIGIKVDDGQILGLRIIASNGEYLADVTWFTCGDEGGWITKEVPNGY